MISNMSHGLKENLIRYLASHNEWRSKGAILQLQWKYYGEDKTYMPDSVSRKLREAEEECRIARRDSGISCEYKFLPPERRKSYIPWSSRPNDKKNILFRG